MTTRYITVETEVEVDLAEFDEDDLIEELERRGVDYGSKDIDSEEMRELLEAIWLKRRVGRSDYQRELDELIWGVIGKIV